MKKLIIVGTLFMAAVTGVALSGQLLPKHHPSDAWSELEISQGKIRQLSMNTHGEIDGVELEDGLTVHFPPHVGRQLTDKLKPGTEVQGFGVLKTSGTGRQLDAKAILIGDKVYFEPSHAALGPKPLPPSVEVEKTVEGNITRWVANPHGDNDGFVLDDQTIVKFPPHLADELGQHLKVGQRVDVTGVVHTTPDGESHLHANTLNSGDWGTQIDRPVPPHKPHPHDESLSREILQELRAIRASMEAK